MRLQDELKKTQSSANSIAETYLNELESKLNQQTRKSAYITHRASLAAHFAILNSILRSTGESSENKKKAEDSIKNINDYLIAKKDFINSYFGWNSNELLKKIKSYKDGDFGSANKRANNMANAKSKSPNQERNDTSQHP